MGGSFLEFGGVVDPALNDGFAALGEAGFDELEVLAGVLLAEEVDHLHEECVLLLRHFRRIILHNCHFLFHLGLFLLDLDSLLWLDLALLSLEGTLLLLAFRFVEVEALSAPPAFPLLHLLSLLLQQLHQLSVLGFVVLLHELLVLLGRLAEG